jgi:hypothetical protein
MLTRQRSRYLLLVLPWLVAIGCSDNNNNNSDAAKHDARPGALDGSIDVTGDARLGPDAGADTAVDAAADGVVGFDLGSDAVAIDVAGDVRVLDGRDAARDAGVDGGLDVSPADAPDARRDGLADGRDAVDVPAIDTAGIDGRSLDGAVDAPAVFEVGGVDASPLILSATLSGGEVVPPITTPATGTASFALNTDGTLGYHITHNVTNVSAVAIYTAAAGTNGNQAVALTPTSADMNGAVTLTPEQSDSLLMGMMYVQITSTAHPEGELRGQILLPAQTLWVASLTGAQEVPPVTSAARGQASLILSADQTTLRYHLTTSGLTATGVRTLIGMAGMQAASAHQLTPIAQTMDGIIILTPADLQALLQKHLSIDVTTTANPGGELRGQIILPGEVLYSATMSASDEVPTPTGSSGTGAAQFILNPSKTTLAYEAVWSQLTGPATQSHIHTGAPGVAGPVLYPLALNAAGTGATGSLTVTPSDVTALDLGQIYVNAHTAANPSGEVRGQLIKQ